MTCRETSEQLAAYLDGELPEDQARGLEQHVAGCDACAMELARTKRLHALLAAPLATPLAAPSAESFDALWQQASTVPLDSGERSASAPRGGLQRRAAARPPRPGWMRRIAAGGIAAGVALGAWWVTERGEVAVERPRLEWAKRAPEPAAAGGERQAVVAAAPKTRSEPAQVAAAPKEPAAVDPVAPVAHPPPRPPRDVRKRPEMFLDYSIVRRLEELENYEAVMAQGRPDDRRS
jgi:anti-sigma factor RsiW